jgi:uncharacterized integral membrane protein (TIGR00698 family)
MSEKQSQWSALIRSEDWLAVWLGFLIIILVIAGLTIKTPKFKWTTEGEFKTLIAEAIPNLDVIAKTAGEKGESAFQAQAVALKTAMEKGDRKGVADAAKKFQADVKEIKDASLKKKASQFGKEIGDGASNLTEKVFESENLSQSLYIGVGILILSAIALAFMSINIARFAIGFPVVFILAWLSLFIAGNSTVNYYGLEYVLWCLALGLLISNVIGVPNWLLPAVRTEFYIKTGLVILGANILFGEILEAGALGMIQGVLVVAVIWYACYWICMKLKIDEEFAAILSSAVSICGVSAAIATSGAIKGDPKKLSYTTSLVLICAVPMLVLQPMISKWFGIPDEVAGAWLGGTLDTSGSVVAAGALISDTAMKVGVIVKMSQNVLIGVAAFILAVVWTFKTAEKNPGAQKPGLIEIWVRFPKFVLGFMAASILFSFILSPQTVGAAKSSLGGIRTIWFALAFTSIGLETNFREISTMGGGRPAAAFLMAQGLNIIWTLILAYLIFGGYLFPVPKF